MIQCADFYEGLKAKGFEFFAGVPDSLLKNFCFYLSDQLPEKQHIITANEGSAVALAAGYHLATGKIPVVYLQNSGLGNTVNPLLSLSDPDVYALPLLLIIGWRGEPGVKDEPQHKKQGRVMLQMLTSMEIPYEIIDAGDLDWAAKIERAQMHLREKGGAFVLAVREGAFGAYELKTSDCRSYEMSREVAIDLILNQVAPRDAVVCTTGKASRELFELRKKREETARADFLVVGGMGHASQIALGIALEKTDRRVFCLDGDGAALMHMGGMSTIGRLKPENFVHVLINNGAHESVGGQPTGAFELDWSAIAKANAYQECFKVETAPQLQSALGIISQKKGPMLIEVRTCQGSRKDLGRPTTSPVENKLQVMRALKT